MGKRNPTSSLSQAALDELLQQLDADRDRAAKRYNRLRDKLIHYFTWERCGAPDDHADEVLDRVARRLSEGEQIQSIDGYIAGVARLVVREAKKASYRTEEGLRTMARTAVPTADDEALNCLEGCLQALAPETRAFILSYYSGDGQERIENRKRLAAEMGMGLNALRNRALRLRAGLHTCVQRCLSGDRDDPPKNDTPMQRGAASPVEEG